jgi:hypothetical protein
MKNNLLVLPPEGSPVWNPLKEFIADPSTNFNDIRTFDVLEYKKLKSAKSFSVEWIISGDRLARRPGSPLRLRSELYVEGDLFSEGAYLYSEWISPHPSPQWNNVYTQIDRITQESLTQFRDQFFPVYQDLALLFQAAVPSRSGSPGEVQ